MHYLITTGPTREFLDDVRFLSNASSGRMGCAVARAAAEQGHRVTLICGPVSCGLPPCDTLIPVTSAQEMHQAVLQNLDDADAVVMTAAVADYRPAQRLPGKIKKSDDDLVLLLECTPDIAAEIGRHKAGRTHVGFALEPAADPDAARDNALRKLREKHLDLIVLNSPAALGAAHARVEFLFASGETQAAGDLSKDDIARRIVAAVNQMRT